MTTRKPTKALDYVSSAKTLAAIDKQIARARAAIRKAERPPTKAMREVLLDVAATCSVFGGPEVRYIFVGDAAIRTEPAHRRAFRALARELRARAEGKR